MADRPIIFSAPMVRALLDGRKTQTRRVLKWQPGDMDRPLMMDDGSWHVTDSSGRHMTPLRVPYATGDRLWVKEGWADEHPLSIQAGRYSQRGRAGIPGPPGVAYRTIYRVDGEPLQVWRMRKPEHPYFTLDGPSDEMAAKFQTVLSNYTRGKGIHWGSSRYMPRWASRLTLLVTAVKVERLQDISEEDAKAEGAGLYVPGHGFITQDELRGDPGYSNFLAPRLGFEVIWTEINGPGAWQANPWVAVITFETHRCNIDKLETANG